ncbi:basic proline-rich protein [Aquila chrysaetos chrysaetos]|uniref:basic proline-rich protein n=1 Tax=Aquila chrysaetos chrysaetos TaxID=223781 RepID=UPI0011771A1C|nr:basic proline-rich protein [Aquila chrysaetos chrysaetos]
MGGGIRRKSPPHRCRRQPLPTPPPTGPNPAPRRSPRSPRPSPCSRRATSVPEPSVPAAALLVQPARQPAAPGGGPDGAARTHLLPAGTRRGRGRAGAAEPPGPSQPGRRRGRKDRAVIAARPRPPAEGTAGPGAEPRRRRARCPRAGTDPPGYTEGGLWCRWHRLLGLQIPGAARAPPQAALARGGPRCHGGWRGPGTRRPGDLPRETLHRRQRPSEAGHELSSRSTPLVLACPSTRPSTRPTPIQLCSPASHSLQLCSPASPIQLFSPAPAPAPHLSSCSNLPHTPAVLICPIFQLCSLAPHPQLCQLTPVPPMPAMTPRPTAPLPAPTLGL